MPVVMPVADRGTDEEGMRPRIGPHMVGPGNPVPLIVPVRNVGAGAALDIRAEVRFGNTAGNLSAVGQPSEISPLTYGVLGADQATNCKVATEATWRRPSCRSRSRSSTTMCSGRRTRARRLTSRRTAATATSFTTRLPSSIRNTPPAANRQCHPRPYWRADSGTPTLVPDQPGPGPRLSEIRACAASSIARLLRAASRASGCRDRTIAFFLSHRSRRTIALATRRSSVTARSSRLRAYPCCLRPS
jgi:hypothetical protein